MLSNYVQPYPDAGDDVMVALKKMAMLWGEAVLGNVALSTAGAGSGFIIPQFDEQVFSYYGSTNNIQTIIYKNAGTPVATLTFEYVGAGVSNDDNVSRITKT